jgi:uncharacterized protein YaaR (DUF327 family)
VKINRRSEKRLQKEINKWKESGETGEVSSEERSSFEETFDENKLELLDLEVQELVEELDVRGQALIDHPTPDQIRDYQQALASFLDKALNLSKEIQRVQGKRNLQDLREGNDQKEHVIVRTIDEKIDSLTEDVLNAQERELDLAERVGEVQGLVVDLVSSIRPDEDGSETTQNLP